MTITYHNGNITLTSFAELGTAFDQAQLAQEPQDSLDEPAHGSENFQGERQREIAPTQDLASMFAQLASMSSSLDSMARQDAHARDRAALDLARYDALIADQQEAQRALDEMRRIRATAEQLAAEAFTVEARAHAAQQAALARANELNCMQFLADRAAALEILVARPHLARALADRRRLADQQSEIARRAEAERTAELSNGLASIEEALTADQVDDAARLVQSLVRQFPDNAEVRKKADTIRWRLRHRLVAPAEQALSDIVRPPYRDDPEAVVARLAQLDPTKLPEDLARRVFGHWSNACYSVIQQRGWHTPKRHAPFIGRGMIFARPTPEGSDTTVSSLGMPEWWPGKVVTEGYVLKTARTLESPKSSRGGR